jgi:hypothetical protein
MYLHQQIVILIQFNSGFASKTNFYSRQHPKKDVYRISIVAVLTPDPRWKSHMLKCLILPVTKIKTAVLKTNQHSSGSLRLNKAETGPI